MRRSRRGFTLLEMLGVMGIMLILVSLSIIGFEHLDASANGKQTRATLDDCTAMLNEYSAESGDSALTTLLSNCPQASASAYGGTALSTPALSMVVNDNFYGRYGTAVQNTWFVMAYLMRVPKVKEMVQKLPPSRVLSTNNTTTGASIPWTPNGGTAGAGVVLLDGWGNPIIFVAPGGLNVWVKNQTLPKSIASRDSRPFFASAGPDGDFGADDFAGPLTLPGSDSWSVTVKEAPSPNVTLSGRTPMGDDNIYSFENGQ